MGVVRLCLLAAERAGTSPTRYGNDFTVFYAAALGFRETGDPYRHAISENEPYLYPPLFAQLLTPLTWLDLPTAAFVWSFLNCLSLGTTVFLSVRMVFPDADRPRTWALCGCLLAVFWRLVVGNLFIGQVNLVVAALVAGFLFFEEKPRRTALAGLLLATAVSIKLTPGLFLPYLAGRKSWRTLGWTGAWGIVLNGLSLAALGGRAPALVSEWFDTVVVQGWRFNWATGSNQSLLGALHRFFTTSATDLSGFPHATIVSLGSETCAWAWRVGVVFLLAAVVRQSRASLPGSDETARVRAAALTCCACLLGSKLSWIGHFTLLILPVACLMQFALSSSGESAARLSRAFTVLLFFMSGVGNYLILRAWNEFLAAYSILTGVTLGTMILFGATETKKSGPAKGPPNAVHWKNHVRK